MISKESSSVMSTGGVPSVIQPSCLSLAGNNESGISGGDFTVAADEKSLEDIISATKHVFITMPAKAG